jgi:hypothetical protein
MNYQQNLSKINNNNPTTYFYYEQVPKENKNQIYELKTGEVGCLYDKNVDMKNNVKINNKFEISPNLTKEEKRKLEQQQREYERQQREILRKKRLEESQKKMGKIVNKNQTMDDYEKDSQKRKEEYEKKMKNL